MQVMPKYQIYWELDCDRPNTGAITINAFNTSAVLQWFSAINFGLRNITLLQIKLIVEDLQGNSAQSDAMDKNK